MSSITFNLSRSRSTSPGFSDSSSTSSSPTYHNIELPATHALTAERRQYTPDMLLRMAPAHPHPVESLVAFPVIYLPNGGQVERALELASTNIPLPMRGRRRHHRNNSNDSAPKAQPMMIKAQPKSKSPSPSPSSSFGSASSPTHDSRKHQAHSPLDAFHKRGHGSVSPNSRQMSSWRH